MLWKRYLLKKIAQNFFLILLCFFILFSLLDFSLHAGSFTKAKTGTWWLAITYYIFMFSNYLDFFLPCSFLLTCLKVFIQLDSHNEFMAFQVAGLCLRKIVLPFFYFAFFLCGISYLNQEFLVPHTKNFAHQTKAKMKKKKQKSQSIKSIQLKDNSQWIYSHFQDKVFDDVYWIQSNDDLWHFQKVLLDEISKEKTGLFADHFQKSSQDILQLTESHPTINLDFIPLDPQLDFSHTKSLMNSSLSDLFSKVFLSKNPSNKTLSLLYYKILQPLILLIMVVALAPWHLSYKRFKPNFLIISFALTAMVMYKAIIEGLLILAESNVINPLVAIGTPFLVMLAIFLPKFLTYDQKLT